MKKLLADLAVEPRGIVYAGAHHGELLPELLDCGFAQLLLVEPSPASFTVIERFASERIRCVRAALVDRSGPVTYYAAPERLDILSSIYEPNAAHFRRVAERTATELRCEKLVVEGVTLDELLASEGGAFNVLYMNIQGAELAAVRGAAASLHGFDVIGCEVDFVPRYDGGALYDELAAHLAARGFRVAGRWRSEDPDNDYGTACFIPDRIASLDARPRES